ncbi:MAG: site-2 protease family protein [Bacillota bacterium]|nr:site-2 protease family protein [Bacillota bacterium]
MRLIRSNPLAVFFLLYMAYQSFMSGQFDNPSSWFMTKLYLLPAILIGLSFHEFAHAAAAYALGDQTPKLQGRVTINPIAHVDPFGFIALIFIGFGWGRPVQVNPMNFKNMRRDGIIVDLAGVTMNFILAILFAGVFKLLILWNPAFMGTYMGSVIVELIYNIIMINIVLMLFNLLPVPPLDGFGIITEVFDLRKRSFYYQLYNNGFVILLLLMMFDITEKVLVPAVSFVLRFVFSIYGLA